MNDLNCWAALSLVTSDKCRQGFPCLAVNLAVAFDPPDNTSAIVKITVPSESLTFHSVR